MEHVKIKEPTFVISLDFEKMWGVFDKRKIDDYGENIKNEAIVISKILELFEKYKIHATWATVGFLFIDEFEKLFVSKPSVLPEYNNKQFSSYNHLNNIRKDDYILYYSGLKSIKEIYSFPNQEIASHTYCHLYCLEDGISSKAFNADLVEFINIAQYYIGPSPSIIFPRNQYNDEILKVCIENNLGAFRGNGKNWIYKSRNQTNLLLIHRCFRFLDSYVNISGNNIYRYLKVYNHKLIDIPSSFFLRPYNNSLKFLEKLKIKRIKKAMLAAAQSNSLFHLWWHPHNFGLNLNENINQLELILQYYTILNEKYGMKSKNMTGVYADYVK
jgi:Polysaccharide deacetylase